MHTTQTQALQQGFWLAFQSLHGCEARPAPSNKFQLGFRNSSLQDLFLLRISFYGWRS